MELETQQAIQAKGVSNENRSKLQKELNETKRLQQEANVAKNNELSALRLNFTKQKENFDEMKQGRPARQKLHLETVSRLDAEIGVLTTSLSEMKASGVLEATRLTKRASGLNNKVEQLTKELESANWQQKRIRGTN